MMMMMCCFPICGMEVVCTHRALLTEAVDALLGVHELDRDVALSLVDEDLPVRGQMDDHGCCHHGVREVGLGKTSRHTKVVLKSSQLLHDCFQRLSI